MDKTRNKHILRIMAGLSLLGFADSAYLTLEHYRGAVPGCSILSGCQDVLTSRFAEVGAIPIALIGAVYYAAVFLLILIYLDGLDDRIQRWIKIFVRLGMAVTLILLFIQAFVLQAFCFYCLLSALLTALLFVFSFLMPRK